MQIAKKHTMNGNARVRERSREGEGERERETHIHIYIHIWGLTMCPTFWHTRHVSPTRHFKRHPQQHPRITTNRQRERERASRSAVLSCSACTRGTKTAFAQAGEQKGEANADSAHRGGCCRGTADDERGLWPRRAFSVVVG